MTPGEDDKKSIKRLILELDPENAMEYHPLHLPDYESAHINIRGGIRLTPGSVDAARQQVIVLGGSTVICSECDDANTLVGALQSCFCLENRFIAVKNWGRWGATVENRVWYLQRHVMLRPRDTVVFWLGVNDTGYRELQHGRGGDRSLGFSVLLAVSRLMYHRFRRRKLTRPLATLLLLGIACPLIASRTAARTMSALRTAKLFCDNHDVNLVAVLQPNLLDIAERIGIRDRRLPSNYVLRSLNWVAYRIYRRQIGSLSLGLIFVDATRILDHDLECFLDWAHLDARGNRLAGEFLHRELTRRILVEN